MRAAVRPTRRMRTRAHRRIKPLPSVTAPTPMPEPLGLVLQSPVTHMTLPSPTAPTPAPGLGPTATSDPVPQRVATTPPPTSATTAPVNRTHTIQAAPAEPQP